MIKTYVMLTKPGIIFGNLVTACGGFFLASRGIIDFGLLLATMVGLSLVIASAGLLNNYLDRRYDEKMERTKNRTIAFKLICAKNIPFLASFLGILGFAFLVIYTNPITVLLALIGFFTYLALYAFWKYRSVHGTIVGSLAGAMPPVIGYCAVKGEIDLAVIILFTIMLLWQMPHFFAIAIHHLKDYAIAKVPVLPVVKGIYATKVHMLCYMITFVLSTFLLPFFGYTGLYFIIGASILGFFWIAMCIQGFWRQDSEVWSKSIFRFSLLDIMLLFLLMSVDYI